MKINLTHCLPAVVIALALTFTGVSHAQSVITSTTTSEGVVSTYGPNGLVITSSAGAEPLRYTASDSTIYVDEFGAPVSTSMVRSGLPVTVHYTRTGDALVASRVIVRRSQGPAVVQPGQAVETVTTSGVINEFGPNGIVVRSESSPQPLRYTSSETTTYVDEAGNPVAVETVRSGAPVTVQYRRVGDSLQASRVIVRRAAAVESSVVVPAPTVKKTTTTTTESIRVRDNDDDDDRED